MQGFKHITPINVRFKDIDALGHVNNAVIFTYVETARVPYMITLGLRSPQTDIRDIGFIVAHVNCNFRQPIFYGQQVEVGTRATQVRRSSFRLEHRVEADGKLAAEGYCIVVHYDYRTGRSTPVTPEMLALLETYEGKALKKALKGEE